MKTTNAFFLAIAVLTLFTACGGNQENYAKTKYPIVMVPGAFAFDNAFGIVDYWYGITNELRDNGAEVYVVSLSSTGAHEVRGEELLKDIESILAITGSPKVNIMAHSQGATASRYVIAQQPEWIASVSCSHCMNEGTHFADNFETFLEQSRLNILVEPALGFIFDFLQLASSSPRDGDFNSSPRLDQDGKAIIEASKHATYDVFNEAYPAAMPYNDCGEINNGMSGHAGGGAPIVDSIRYYSWGGASRSTNFIDPLEAIVLPLTSLFVPNNIVWDGLVPLCGQALGKLLKSDYDANHFDAINQALGITSSEVDVPSIYTAQANRLKKAGL
jgi:triacylglycerol lipase